MRGGGIYFHVELFSKSGAMHVTVKLCSLKSAKVVEKCQQIFLLSVKVGPFLIFLNVVIYDNFVNYGCKIADLYLQVDLSFEMMNFI